MHVKSETNTFKNLDKYIGDPERNREVESFLMSSLQQFRVPDMNTESS